MPQSLHSNFAHLVFSTKNREATITGDIASRLYSYMAGIVTEKGAVPVAINGMPDHVHLLIKASKNITDAQFMKELKGGSSVWMNENHLISKRFKWQAGYGWFSVSPKDTGEVVAYIENQAEHHKRATFEEEYRRFLVKYQVDFDERYVWD